MATSKREQFVESVLAVRVGHCVTWPFAVRRSSGYGAHNIRMGGRKRNIDAHRYVCGRAHGAPLAGQEAAHRCGNKLCVNPEHLYWADHKTNMQDAVQQGTIRGGGRYRQRLFEAEIADICQSADSLLALAARYGSNVSHMSRIRRRHADKGGLPNGA